MNADIKHLPALFRKAEKAVERLDTLAPLSGAEDFAAGQVAATLEALEGDLEDMLERIVAVHDDAKALRRRIKKERAPARNDGKVRASR
ncbi:hypothetical protein UFOVP783_14 [uncultured Caudovirales phage]|uniref:Uncharacterized protein n=1 Tax=uncultured Caudovirales phage TaxID=2100421 RepID=A0A6J5NYC8_9CAUD|nr:hypothetical protein UFOVP783_14 [uncultured Caudovirales phage]